MKNLYLSTIDALQPVEQRLLKVLTFHILRKVKFFFKWNLNAFYNAPRVYESFIKNKNPVLYDSSIYRNIALFNSCGLATKVLKHIVGAYPGTNKPIPYRPILETLVDMGLIQIRQQGSIVVKKVRHHYSNCYVVSRDLIESCIKDQNLLKQVLDPTSKFYSKTETRIIFNQLLRKKKSSKTSTQDCSFKQTNEEKLELEKINAILHEISIEQSKNLALDKYAITL